MSRAVSYAGSDEEFTRTEKRKSFGFLSFGHWQDSLESGTRTAVEAYRQSIELVVAAEETGVEGRTLVRRKMGQDCSGTHVPTGCTTSPRPERRRCSSSAIDGEPLADADPQWAHRAGRVPIEPRSPGLRHRIRWGAGTQQTAIWAAEQGLNLQSSTVLLEDTGIADLLAADEAIKEADTVLLAIPTHLGVEHATGILENIVDHVAPATGWR